MHTTTCTCRCLSNHNKIFTFIAAPSPPSRWMRRTCNDKQNSRMWSKHVPNTNLVGTFIIIIISEPTTEEPPKENASPSISGRIIYTHDLAEWPAAGEYMERQRRKVHHTCGRGGSEPMAICGYCVHMVSWPNMDMRWQINKYIT